MGSFTQFHKRSIQDRDNFWAEQAKTVDWQIQPQQICDYSNPPLRSGSSVAPPICATTQWIGTSKIAVTKPP